MMSARKCLAIPALSLLLLLCVSPAHPRVENSDRSGPGPSPAKSAGQPPAQQCPNGAVPYFPKDGDKCDPNVATTEFFGLHLGCCGKLVSTALKAKKIYLEAGREDCKDASDCLIAHDSCSTTGWSHNDTVISVKKCYPVQCPLAVKTPELKTCDKDDECGQSKMCMTAENLDNVDICCGVDPQYMCPGDYYPKSNCKNGYFTTKNGKRICCPIMVSEIFKKKKVDWKIAGDEIEMATNTARTCAATVHCGHAEYCDASKTKSTWKGSGKLKNCYKIPQCHGEQPKNVTACSDHNDCNLANGELCDMKLTDLNSGVKWKGVGICCQFKCPLSTQLISQGSRIDEEHLCQTDEDCGSYQKQCHAVGKGNKYKACCPLDEEYRCPGDILPTRIKDKLNHVPGEAFHCDVGEVETTKGVETLCCPPVISYDLHTAGLSGKPGIVMEPADLGALCTGHGSCRPGEFCGESMLKSPEKKLSPAVSHCYRKPLCTGTVVATADPKGLKTCSANNECGQNEACDLNLGSGGKGMCCSFICSAQLPEAKGTAGVAKKICTGCDRETEPYSFCDNGLVNNDQQVDVCERTGAGQYRQCTYQRDPAKCPSDYHSPLRSKVGHALLLCQTDYDCRMRGVLLTERSRCVGSGHASLAPGTKYCCRGDLCPDMYLWRTKEKTCSSGKDCEAEGSAGICEKDTLGRDKTSHCCPRVDEMSTRQRILVEGPYRSSKKCNTMEECYGEHRFCDPYTQTCMYHKKTLNSGEYQHQDRCTRADVHCGKKRIVCMAMEVADEPKCYRHPLDECDGNARCHGGKYCAPKDESLGDDSLRVCHPVPVDAVLDSSGMGLAQCQRDADCPSTENICQTGEQVAGLRPSYGYCKQRISRQCKGQAMLTYNNGQLSTCAANKDCKNNEFCDLEVKPAVGQPGRGVCCSVPTSCGGEVVRKADAGLKLCKKDDGRCSLKDGEICSLKITRVANSLWQKEDGVCCRMECPAAVTPDLEATAPPAGQLCSKTDCKNDETALRTCEEAADTGEKRCCEYKRKPGLCPADKTSGLLLAADFKAVECNGGQKCPDKADCFNGVCCKVQWCPDSRLRLEEQLKCSTVADCGQPLEEMATCEKGHCCPQATNGEISQPFVTMTTCQSVEDCAEKRMFCEPTRRKCTYFGEDSQLETTATCQKGEAVCEVKKGVQGVCVYGEDDRTTPASCWMNPLDGQKTAGPMPTATGGSGAQEDGISTTTIVIIIVAMVILLAALIGGGFYYYKRTEKKRQAAREKRKKEKAKERKRKPEKEQKKEKTNKSSSTSESQQSELQTPTPTLPKKEYEPLKPLFLTL